ncbi:hypothetical protein AF332_03695 [Sporosarcina globispora]|uniref:Uncharacterized protein n=1 Tax=Sporosarcina globispora TaxID=1459 RepID=A0A0M0G916_SPOGL|nr:hypothetical protein AF332_03695 [Sporosarcina globispora]
MTEKVIKDSRQLTFPRLKVFFDCLFLIGSAMLIIKLSILGLNHFTALEIPLRGSFFWNFGPLLLMAGGAIFSDTLKKKYKNE